MSRFLKISIGALAALSMWACVENANMNRPANTNSNSNANTTAAKAPPTVDALMATEKQAQEAYAKGDGAFFENMLSDKFSMNMGAQRFDKAAAVKMISGTKCDLKTPSTYDEQKMAMIDPDTVALVYKATMDGTCTSEGKTTPVSGPMRVATVLVRNGDKWQAIWHGETPISDPKNPAKPPPAAPAAKDDKMASNSNTNTNSATAPAADANVEAMAATEKAGWEAWKAHDANKLNELTTKDVSFVNNFGGYATGQADVVKGWTDVTCDVKSVDVTDVHGTTIAPTLGFIIFKGTADGSCGDMKVMPVWATSFYVKDGGTWKLAFGFESPA